MTTLVYKESDFTYEAGIDEPIHPDVDIALRFREYRMSDCAFGCKIYRDPVSGVKVLAHFSIYGCRKKREDII